MKFRMEIEIGNDTMQTLEDVGRVVIEVGRFLILRHPMSRLELEDLEDIDEVHKLRDSNGNTVGSWRFER